MTITNITHANNGLVPAKPVVNHLQDMPRETDARDMEQPKEDNADKIKSAEKAKISPEHLVMKPNPISVEERLNQVISLEDIKSLLAVKGNAFNPETKDKHLIDVKR
ncbi:MAG: hypothetical protein K8R21_09275 [Leptospira sp.]|nr:hypothetical protein [Leptospira sp.]